MRRELLAILIVAACNGANRSKPVEPEPTEPTEAAGSATVAAANDDAPVFRLEVAPPASCAVGAACEARIVLTALGAYKVNKEYPFKFVADPGPGVSIDGTGTFAPTDAKTGTMTVRFRAEAAGTSRVSGTFKLSVCTDDICKIEAAKVAFDVPVS